MGNHQTNASFNSTTSGASRASRTSRWNCSVGTTRVPPSGPLTLDVLVVRVVEIGLPAKRGLDIVRRGCQQVAGRAVPVRPYVEVEIGNSRFQTNPVDTVEGGEATFAARLAFVLDRDVLAMVSSPTMISDVLDEDGSGRKLSIRVFGERGTGRFRRDPLIGTAEVAISAADICGRGTEVTVDIERGGWPRGAITLRYAVRPERGAYSVVSEPADHSVCEIANALAQILSGAEGLDILYDALPEALTGLLSKTDVQNELQNLLLSLCTQVSLLVGEADDEVVLERFARLSHSVQTSVAQMLASQGGAVLEAEVENLTRRWIRRIFEQCSQRSAMPRLRDRRLLEFMKAGRKYPALTALKPVSMDSHKVLEWNGFPQVPWAARIDRGGQGEVWLFKNIQNGEFCAVKVSARQHRPSDRREPELVDHILMAPHPCIVKLLGAFHLHGSSIIVMEYCSGGNLKDRISAVPLGPRSEYQPPPQALDWFGQIFLALEHLHLKLKTLVRDVKPANVIITASNHAKLTDFGHGRIGARSTGAFTLHYGPPGTAEFVAPEVVLKRPYDYRADLYSLGVLLWVLQTGGLKRTGLPPVARYRDHNYEALAENPRLLERCIRQPLREGARPLPCAASRDLVTSLTQVKMDNRPDHAQIRRHRFMTPLRLPEMGSSTQEVELWMQTSHHSRAQAQLTRPMTSPTLTDFGDSTMGKLTRPVTSPNLAELDEPRASTMGRLARPMTSPNLAELDEPDESTTAALPRIMTAPNLAELDEPGVST